MSKHYCCVPGCVASGDTHPVLHVFPNPKKYPDRFRSWVMAVGGDILGLDNQYIYTNRRVCHCHFEEKHCCRFNRLSQTAVPRKNLSGTTTKATSTKATQENVNDNATQIGDVQTNVDLTAPNSSQTRNVSVRTAEYPKEGPRTYSKHPVDDVRLKPTLGSDIGEEFRNRKGYFSLNVQAACDADLRFMNVVARWPGSAHDATIFNNSLLRDDQIITNVADDTDIEWDDNISDNDVTTEEVPDVAATFTWQRPSEVINSDDEANVEYFDTEMTDDVMLFNDIKSSAKSARQVTVTNKNVSTKQGDALSGAETQPHSHKEYKCDICSGPIQGFRYRCVQCVDYDLCAACESRGAHERHYVLRIPVHRPYAEIETVLQKIRTELVSGTHSILFEDTQMLDSIKEEIKAEEDDPLVFDATNPAAPFFKGADETRSEVMSNVNQSDGEKHRNQGCSERDKDFKRKKRKLSDSDREHDYAPRTYKIQIYSRINQNSNETPNLDNEIQKQNETAAQHPHGLDKRKFLIRKSGENCVAVKNIQILKTIANKTTNKLSDTDIVTQLKLLNTRRTVQPATDSPSTSVPLKHISMRPSDSRSTPSVLKKAQIVIKKFESRWCRE